VAAPARRPVGESDGRALAAGELAAMARVRRFGAVGTVMMAIGALGAGARPVVQDPVFGVRLLNLPSRIQTVALTMTVTGVVIMVLAWLMLGRYVLRPRCMQTSELYRTLWLWMAPLLLAPPMYSKDVYSYLAQSQIARQGGDPYRVGPVQGLGLDHVLTMSVPTIWRDTPAPYGSLFLWIGEGFAKITGEDIVWGVFCHRLIALTGLMLILWALPRLARRSDVAVVSAVWLGALNPLLLMHLIAGIHNEALMIGLMLAGMELALAGVERAGPVVPWLLLAGTVLIALSAQIKLPSLLALGFVGMALARRRGATLKAVVVSAVGLGAVAGVVIAVVGTVSGLGFGWLFTLGTANIIRSWMSPPTLLALATGEVGRLLGLGDHTSAVLSLTRGVGVLAGVAVVLALLWAVLRGRLDAVGGPGVALGATVLLSPVSHPWYLLWTIVPLAAWVTRRSVRRVAVGATALIAVFGPTANGDRFAWFQIFAAYGATTVVVMVLIVITYRWLPWRDPSGL
jgi:alpha-1,6-mannosyltransferase